MRQNAATRAVKGYLTTTTLHGFKYLRTPKLADRTIWATCCFASAACAGALCLVLWSRFTQVPTLLTLKAAGSEAELPPLALCVPAPIASARLVRTLNASDPRALTSTLTRVLRGLAAPAHRLIALEQELKASGQTLPEALQRQARPCDQVLSRCQLDGRQIKCDQLVHKDITKHGTCCVLRPLSRSKRQDEYYTIIKTLEVVLNFSDTIQEYDFFLHHEEQGWLKSSVISPGFTYYAPLTYKYVVSDDGRLIESDCVADGSYSFTACESDCIESACGCTDPMETWDDELDDVDPLPVCPLEKLSCLRNFKANPKSCDCYLPCKQVRTNMSLKQYPMMEQAYFITDPLFRGLNSKRSAVIRINVERVGSYIFARMPTESWLTLMSSLGGVFNMFLGVGLFSALELIYFIFIRIPIAIRRSLEIEISSAVVPLPKMSVS